MVRRPDSIPNQKQASYSEQCDPSFFNNPWFFKRLIFTIVSIFVSFISFLLFAQKYRYVWFYDETCY